ncbi:peptidylprolyl isomerase [Chitinophagaceae bacterium MMS25-I14]
MRRISLLSVPYISIAVISVLLLFSAGRSFAQQIQTADKILAVVGRNRIILQSELEAQAAQARQQNPDQYNDTIKCGILQQMILSKMLMEQAERDSLLVSDEDVEAQLDNKIRYFIQSQFGTKEKLEEMMGKTVYQIKEDNKDAVREQMMAEKVQSKILEHVFITPTEVKAFYEKYRDSLPYFPAAVEIGEIVVDPPVSPEMSEYARKKLEDIRNQIVKEGKSFETMAGIYSDDPGSRDNGGRYDGVTRTGGFAQEFVTAAFKLKDGEISQIVKTSFGYHIIQMIHRRGEQVDIRHILITPERTSADFKAAMEKLDSVRAELISGKINFPQAVGKYSTDDATKLTGGMITDQRTNSTQLQIDQLDPTLALMVDSIKLGTYSQPQQFTKANGEKSCRIVYMKDRTEPHKANLKDDYNRIQEVALAQKKNQKIQQWLEDKLPSYYLKIDPEYSGCNVFKPWQKYISQ